MIKNIKSLPNYYNGKLYKRWASVHKAFGAYVYAYKTLKNGESRMLFISNNGKNKELFSNNGKITDITDSKGVKRTYVHDRISSDTTEGKMIVSCKDAKEEPLLLGAFWRTTNLVPKVLKLIINPNHPKSRVFIPNKNHINDTPYMFGLGRHVNAVEVEASDFQGFNIPIPGKFLVKTDKGKIEPLIASDVSDIARYASYFRITGEELGNHLTTMV